MKKNKSIYQEIAKHTKSQLVSQPPFSLASIIRDLRIHKNISGADLCRKAGDLDPRTLTAVEKGRIKNPSLLTLQSIARGLGVSIADLFSQAELLQESFFSVGSQKGSFQMDIPQWGVKVVGFTPLIREFFFGKFIFNAKSILKDGDLKHRHPIYVSVLVGRFEVIVGNKKAVLKEGENIFFRGVYPHSIQNLLQKESVLFLMTAPSFL